MPKLQQSCRYSMQVTDCNISFPEARVDSHCIVLDNGFAASVSRVSNADLIPSLVKLLTRTRNVPTEEGHHYLLETSGAVNSDHPPTQCVKCDPRPLASHMDKAWDNSSSVRRSTRETDKPGRCHAGSTIRRNNKASPESVPSSWSQGWRQSHGPYFPLDPPLSCTYLVAAHALLPVAES